MCHSTIAGPVMQHRDALPYAPGPRPDYFPWSRAGRSHWSARVSAALRAKSWHVGIAPFAAFHTDSNRPVTERAWKLPDNLKIPLDQFPNVWVIRPDLNREGIHQLGAGVRRPEAVEFGARLGHGPVRSITLVIGHARQPDGYRPVMSDHWIAP